MKYKFIQNRNSGFIALISTLILSVVLAMIIMATSTSSFFARFDTQNREFKRQATRLAQSCRDVALLRLAQNYSYDPTDDPDYVSGKGLPVAVGDDTCYIVATSPSGSRSGNSTDITITTRGIYHNTYSNMEIVVTVRNPDFYFPPTLSPISIISTEEF